MKCISQLIIIVTLALGTSTFASTTEDKKEVDPQDISWCSIDTSETTETIIESNASFPNAYKTNSKEPDAIKTVYLDKIQSLLQGGRIVDLGPSIQINLKDHNVFMPKRAFDNGLTYESSVGKFATLTDRFELFGSLQCKVRRDSYITNTRNKHVNLSGTYTINLADLYQQAKHDVHSFKLPLQGTPDLFLQCDIKASRNEDLKTTDPIYNNDIISSNSELSGFLTVMSTLFGPNSLQVDCDTFDVIEGRAATRRQHAKLLQGERASDGVVN